MFRRISASQATPQHGKRPAAGCKRASMRGRIDASRQPAHDREARARQPAGQLFGDQTSGRSPASGADNRDGQVVRFTQRPRHIQERWRIRNRQKTARITGIQDAPYVDLFSLDTAKLAHNTAAGVAVRTTDDRLSQSGAAAPAYQVVNRGAKHRIRALPFSHQRQDDTVAHALDRTKLHPSFERRRRGMSGRRRMHEPSQGLPANEFTPAQLGRPGARLHHHEIVLFQVQLLIRHDKDFGGAFALQGLEPLPFLVLKESRDGRMGAHDDPLLFVS